MFLRKSSSFKTIYLFTTLGFATHGLLDACTSYGTRLYWPLSNFRVSWNTISIIDPIYTIPLLIFFVLSVVRKSPLLMRIGMGLSLCYLALGFIKHKQVESYIYALAEKRGHTVERILLNPTIGNNILWRTVYLSKGYYYINAVYYPMLAEPIMQEGVRVKAIDKETVFPKLGKDSVQREDIRRFSYFSQDFIYIHPTEQNIIADLRYGTLPYDNKPLWGIEIDTKYPEKHVTYKNLRTIDEKHYDEFWLMLNGSFKLPKAF
jgi:inner membrane protein